MHQEKQNEKPKHLPVLLDEVLHYLNPRLGDSYLDLTAGYGGHAKAVLRQTANLRDAVLVDRDARAIRDLRRRFQGEQVSLRQQDFLSASEELVRKGRRFDLVLVDLGVSSPHLNEGDRGFSFNNPGPLDMRMDQSSATTAADIVNTYSETQLADILKRFGEEPKARQIARMIVAHRPFITTTELTSVVVKAWPGHSRIHPATRTFQAIRIAVNDELYQLERSMPLWLALLKSGGRIVVISFHSLEDRLVKQFFNEHAGNRYDAALQLLTKHPVTVTPQELVSNPRARSAKLRAAAKIKTRKERTCQ